jgi:hypothetical protein
MQPRSMQRRWIVGIGLGAAAAAALFLWTRRDAPAGPPPASAASPARGAPPAQARRAVRGVEPRPVPAAVPGHRGGDAPSGMADPSPGVKKWTVPGQNGWFREIVAPDDSENVEEKMIYRTRRLRFELTDAAAACYDGPDGTESIGLTYELVITGGEMRVRDVQVVDNTLTDPGLRDCILGAVRSLSAPAPDLPDMRRHTATTIGVHDLWVRNRFAD